MSSVKKKNSDDGDDNTYISITQEHVATKSALQKKECKIFHEIAGNNYIGAQVEDVFGTNHFQNLYKTTPFDIGLK